VHQRLRPHSGDIPVRPGPSVDSLKSTHVLSWRLTPCIRWSTFAGYILKTFNIQLAISRHAAVRQVGFCDHSSGDGNTLHIPRSLRDCFRVPGYCSTHSDAFNIISRNLMVLLAAESLRSVWRTVAFIPYCWHSVENLFHLNCHHVFVPHDELRCLIVEHCTVSCIVFMVEFSQADTLWFGSI
jgi:hypothetical protein